MSNKKHIDRLFQERFKNFEATPSDTVWNNIRAELDTKKKKRRIIAIWWRYAGIAALLVLLITAGALFFNDADTVITNQVGDTENLDSEELKTRGSDPSIDSHPKTSNTNDAVVESNSGKNALEKTTQNTIKKDSDAVMPSTKTSITGNASSKHKNESRLKTHQNPDENSKLPRAIIKTDRTLLAVQNSENNTKEKNNKPIQNKNKLAQFETNKESEIINNPTKSNTVIAETEQEKKTEIIAENTKENTLTIEEALDKNNDIFEEEEKGDLNRWSITPNAAPVYFSSLGNGSSIDPQFKNNPQSGEINMSYGIKARYAINKKLSIRTGISKVNLGYHINNVIVFQSINSDPNPLQNVNFNTVTTNSVSFVSGDNLSALGAETFTENRKTSIDQDMGYLEVPLEIQYALSNKNFGINLIGGFSALFLNKNEIFSEIDGYRTLLGKANNINKVSYSANFGLGLNYKIFKKIDLNFEPMFKYQINTFNNTSGNFKPYFIGVYTGFTIKF